jgi:hypothetical protein
MSEMTALPSVTPPFPPLSFPPSMLVQYEGRSSRALSFKARGAFGVCRNPVPSTCWSGLAKRCSGQPCCPLTRGTSYSIVQGTATIRLDN